MVKRVMTLSKEESARLIGCALGEIPADLVMRGGKLVNVYSGELLEGMEIAVIAAASVMSDPARSMRAMAPPPR